MILHMIQIYSFRKKIDINIILTCMNIHFSLFELYQSQNLKHVIPSWASLHMHNVLEANTSTCWVKLDKIVRRILILLLSIFV